MSLDALAARYVTLVLGIGEHDPDYVDAYYGPPAVRDEVKAARAPLPRLAADADELVRALARLPRVPADAAPADVELLGLRHDYLSTQARSAAARIAILQGATMRFDDESRALYDAVAPRHGEAELQATLDRIDGALRALPASALAVAADAPLRERVAALRALVTIPPAKVGAVFERAIAECRARTARRLPLPAGESFTVEQVTDQPWSAYNWYQGGYRSLIQLNVSLPIWMDLPIALACHEGYPGHHVYNLLLEQELVRGRGWPEYQVYPLFSPQSLIAEGTANAGVELAFPLADRIAFARDVLYPLAELDPALAEPYERIAAQLRALSYASNEAARRRLDDGLDAAATAAWLERYGLYTPERAAQRVRFIDRYRSYVINYNLGEDLVKAHVDGEAGPAGADADDEARAARRWAAFRALLSSPRLPSGLIAPAAG